MSIVPVFTTKRPIVATNSATVRDPTQRIKENASWGSSLGCLGSKGDPYRHFMQKK